MSTSLRLALDYVLYAPEIQVPFALACACLVIAAAVWRSRLSDALRVIAARSVLWLLLIAWFLRSEPTFKGAEIVGLSFGLALGLFTWAVLGLRRAVVTGKGQIVVGILLALIASFGRAYRAPRRGMWVWRLSVAGNDMAATQPKRCSWVDVDDSFMREYHDHDGLHSRVRARASRQRS